LPGPRLGLGAAAYLCAGDSGRKGFLKADGEQGNFGSFSA
jgi:hypothetical protein